MRVFLLIFCFLLIPQYSFSQAVAGKIITSSEADSLFGKPNYSIEFSTSQLSEYGKHSRYLFISISDRKILITGEDRKVLYPQNYVLAGSEIFHVYSTPVISELINNSPGKPLYIEVRKDVLTLTCGDFTLEFGFLCPPYCNYD